MDVFMSSLTHHLFILMEYGGCRVIMLITFYVAKGERSHIDCPPDYLGGYWPVGQSMQIYQNNVEMNWSSIQPTGFGIYFL